MFYVTGWYSNEPLRVFDFSPENVKERGLITEKRKIRLGIFSNRSSSIKYRKRDISLLMFSLLWNRVSEYIIRYMRGVKQPSKETPELQELS